MIMAAKPSHLPSMTSQRCSGLVTMLWIECEAISPETVLTEMSTLRMTMRKLTA